MNLNQTLQEKYPHLEVSVLSLNEVQKDNESKRIDSEYFRKEYLENENKLKNIQSRKLRNVCSFIANGDDCRDYEINGKKYIRTGNFKEYELDLDSAEIIRFDFNSKIKLDIDDLLVTRKGNYGKSQVIHSKEILNCIISSEIFQLKLKNINPFYIDIFFKIKIWTIPI